MAKLFLFIPAFNNYTLDTIWCMSLACLGPNQLNLELIDLSFGITVAPIVQHNLNVRTDRLPKDGPVLRGIYEIWK